MNFSARSQDTLPKFTLTQLGDDKVLIEWKNPDTSLRQISVQQSTDSLIGFKTLLNILDPRLAQNGSVIRRPMAQKMYYRLYLLYPRGRYLFTPAKRPTPQTPIATKESPPKKNTESPILTYTKPAPITVPGNQQIKLITTPIKQERSDSVSRNRPSMVQKARSELIKDPEAIKPVATNVELTTFVPSNRIYTQKDGYPYIELPAEWDLAQIEIRFFMESGQPLFELIHPSIRIFRIDKTNFSRSGWYRFEIWWKGKKMETNKLFIPLEF